MSARPALWLVHALGDSRACFDELLRTRLASELALRAPDWPGAGDEPVDRAVADLEGLADWLARTIARETPDGPIGLVGHSLGAAVAVKVARRVGRVVGLVSIEGNLTPADGYFSGRAASFARPEAFRDDLRERVRALAEAAPAEQRAPLRRYQAALERADAETIWSVGRSAHAVGRRGLLGAEYRALTVPTSYLWSPTTTPTATQHYLRKHALRNAMRPGGHWPMIERPEETAAVLAAVFQPLSGAGHGAGNEREE
jgi:pimeloyl-ACP methyl ester carboxylesterase